MDLGRALCPALQLVGLWECGTGCPGGSGGGESGCGQDPAGSEDQRANLPLCPRAGGAEPWGAPAPTLRKVNFKIMHEATLNASAAVGLLCLFFFLPWMP